MTLVGNMKAILFFAVLVCGIESVLSFTLWSSQKGRETPVALNPSSSQRQTGQVRPQQKMMTLPGPQPSPQLRTVIPDWSLAKLSNVQMLFDVMELQKAQRRSSFPLEHTIAAMKVPGTYISPDTLRKMVMLAEYTRELKKHNMDTPGLLRQTQYLKP